MFLRVIRSLSAIRQRQDSHLFASLEAQTAARPRHVHHLAVSFHPNFTLWGYPPQPPPRQLAASPALLGMGVGSIPWPAMLEANPSLTHTSRPQAPALPGLEQQQQLRQTSGEIDGRVSHAGTCEVTWPSVSCQAGRKPFCNYLLSLFIPTGQILKRSATQYSQRADTTLQSSLLLPASKAQPSSPHLKCYFISSDNGFLA